MGFFCANNYDTTKERVMMRDARKKKWGPSKSPLPLRLSKSLPDDRFFFPSETLKEAKLFFGQLKNGVPF